MRGHLPAFRISCSQIAVRAAITIRDVPDDVARRAHADLLGLPIDLLGYAPFADRIWALRTKLPSYDAWYVPVAEALEARLATLDRRLVGAPGPRCAFHTIA